MVAILAEEMLREEMEIKDANGDLTDDNVEEDKGDAEEVNNEKDELLLSSEDEEVEQKQRLVVCGLIVAVCDLDFIIISLPSYALLCPHAVSLLGSLL